MAGTCRSHLPRSQPLRHHSISLLVTSAPGSTDTMIHNEAAHMRWPIVLITALLLCGEARAECHADADKPPKPGAFVTCVPLTEQLLVSLQNASVARVREALKTEGSTRTEGGKTILYFVSHADQFGGDMNFEFNHDRTDRIFGYVNNPGGHAMEFTWNPAHRGADGNGGVWTGTCSDLPNSRYPKCHK
jgi:hypothetical protein